MSKHPKQFPPQHQDDHPGHEHEMKPEPQYSAPFYKGSGKLKGKVALVTGGDSGIGRAVSILYAREGADVAILYYDEHEDAEKTKGLVEAEGARCLTIAGDIGDATFCQAAVEKVISTFKKIDVLVNNAAFQQSVEKFEDLPHEQLERTFRTNVFGAFYLTQAVLPHMKKGSAIVNSTSVVAFKGNPKLIDYSATKGALLAFTRALSGQLAERGIRVNSVAPGPIWTPFIPSAFPAEEVAKFGQDTPLGRAGQPEELAPAYVYLACEDSSYVTGQTIHVNGGHVVGG